MCICLECLYSGTLNHKALFSVFGGSATGTAMDIVVSSVRAYVNALNKMLGFKKLPGVVVNSENSQVSD